MSNLCITATCPADSRRISSKINKTFLLSASQTLLRQYKCDYAPDIWNSPKCHCCIYLCSVRVMLPQSGYCQKWVVIYTTFFSAIYWIYDATCYIDIYSTLLSCFLIYPWAVSVCPLVVLLVNLTMMSVKTYQLVTISVLISFSSTIMRRHKCIIQPNYVLVQR
jgi:hypothetical protein